MTKEQPIKSFVLNETEYKELCNRVIDMGLFRRKDHPEVFREDDYLSGAMSVMAALGMPLPMWPLMIMSGRKVIQLDIERVNEAEDKDLPLLVGDVKDDSAVKEFERRLKRMTMTAFVEFTRKELES